MRRTAVGGALGGLALMFTEPAAAQTSDISVRLTPSSPQKTVTIDCSALGDVNRPNLQTMTRLDSLVHGYRDDLYFNATARARAADAAVQANAGIAPTAIRKMFNRPYEGFDRLPPAQRMNYVVGKLDSHGITPPDINAVLEECRR